MKAYVEGIASFFLCALVASTSVNAEALTPDQDFIMEQCCMEGSYTTGDQNQYTLRNPVSGLFEDLTGKIDDATRQRLNAFVSKVAAATGLDIHIFEKENATIVPGSRLAIIVVPQERKNLTQTMVDTLHLQLPLLDKAPIAGTSLVGINASLSLIYSKNEFSILHARNFKNGHVFDSVMIVKKDNTISLLSLIERAYLEGVGYNVDNRAVEGTLFANRADENLNDNDLAILRKLYNQ